MFWKNLVSLCIKKQTTPTAVVRKLGIANGVVTRWKSGSVPRDTTLQKLADYFNVSVDYLTGKDVIKEKSADEAAPPRSEATFLDGQNIFMVPIYDKVSAGFGAIAIDEVVDYMPLYFTSPMEAKETICIRVKGDSMFPTIEDGDLIQVHKQTSVDSGSVAVVLLDGEDALVKKITYGADWIELHSFNPMYKTMRFNGSDVLRLQVVGLVKRVIKDL